MDICQECKAMLKFPNEYHPYEYCLMAKIAPSTWRIHLRKIIENGDKFEKEI